MLLGYSLTATAQLTVKLYEDRVLRLNDGQGVNITLDIAGTKTIEQSLLSLKENGFLATAGFISGSAHNIPLICLLYAFRDWLRAVPKVSQK
ncbi:NADPH:quinone reductase-like Zn-dependent oxidoreductase [Pedobacter sp. AK017]|nr:NADPH:quinone reductase-like Zn-dependent oxidoreductase [Pedobacter sp. AK017]